MAPGFLSKKGKNSGGDGNSEVIELGDIKDDQLPLFGLDGEESRPPSFLGGDGDSGEEVVPVFETSGSAPPSFEADSSVELSKAVEKIVDLENRLSQLDSSMALIKSNSDSYNDKVSSLEGNLSKLTGIYEQVTNEMGALKAPGPAGVREPPRPLAPAESTAPENIDEPDHADLESVAPASPASEPTKSPSNVVGSPRAKQPMPMPEPYPADNQHAEETRVKAAIGTEDEDESLNLDGPILSEISDSPIDLFFILKWLDFMLKQGGYYTLLEALDFYVDVEWISQGVKELLVRHAKGIRNSTSDIAADACGAMSFDDHMTSLIFISKLASVELNPRVYNRISDRLMELGLLDY
ncbi:archaeal flagella protein [archaeon BMS3Bbin16]|nr:archaeal flagella protein [archaeon BMS3Bbin16]